ncbi:transglycosylase domain-containing protein [Streptomyces sp. SID6673]|nr:transglycosylase domain-containing protein [Streptomyces sp. SID11726]NDZ94924.1 transglycosylase domain-containing protein [Streptomyces sp. SID11726]NEB23083.1 transglycosylase domain-containing protein [Streptomyces sp. SID6673]
MRESCTLDESDLAPPDEYYDLPPVVDDEYYPDVPFDDEPPETEPEHKPRRRLHQVLATAFFPFMLFVWCATHNVYEPGETAFMHANEPYIHEWVDLDHISRHPIAAALILEDVDMGNRTNAFDVGRFVGTAQSYLGGQSDIDGGSTIPQQLVKNLYFSPDRSAWRKAGEAFIALPFAWTVSDSRMLEMYMNYAQFGPKLYGICAAAWYYFDSPPWSLTQNQGAQLAAIVRLPSEARRAEGGGVYVLGPNSDADFRDRVYNRVPRDLAFLGGYEPLMESVGIDDDASDHEHIGENSCSAMPADVEELLVAEGVR